MRKRVSELGLVLLCTGLVLVAATATGQTVSDAKSVAQAVIQSTAAQNAQPVVRDLNKVPAVKPITAYNPAPVKSQSAALSPAAAAPVQATSIRTGSGSQPATSRVVPDNDDCTNAIPVDLSGGTVVVTGDNTGATEDCASLSGGSYGESWYLLQVPSAMDVSIQYCGTSPAFTNAYIVMDTTCPCSGAFIFANNWSNTAPCTDGNWTLNWTNLAAGTYYWPLLCDAVGGASGPYTVTFVPAEVVPCDVECPPGAEMEPEDCGGDTDGGCNATPAIFAPIECGMTVCGTAWASTSLRDTDWYQVTVTEPKRFVWAVEAEFPVLIFIIRGAGPDDCSSYSILASATAAECTPVSLDSGAQGPGTYWFWVGSSTFANYPCPLEYVATLTCSEPPPCTPDFHVEGPYPYTNSGATCGAGNDCGLRSTEEVMYEVVLPETGKWKFSLCGSDYDTYLFIGTMCCLGDIASNDDYCGLQSEITLNNLPAGTYYVTIEGYSGCGNYQLLIDLIPPCQLECPPGSEFEPEDCGGDTDGGCNTYPYVYAPIECGMTVCGSAWASTSMRDTDWYQLTTTQTTTFTWTVDATFPVLIFVIRGAGPDDCSSYSILYSASAVECTPVSINSGPQPAGTYWFWVGSSTFADIPCPQTYWATLDCYVPTGACCVDLVCVATNTEGQCADLGGFWFANQTCPAFTCPSGCPHHVVLYDCYGDGWNGNTMDVLVNGVTQLSQITLASGAGPESYMFIANTGDTIQTIYYPIGGWPYEPYYYIYDGQGYLLGSDGIVGTDCYVQPTGITVTANCEIDYFGACCYYNGDPCVRTLEADCVGGLWLGQGSQCSQCPCLVPCPPGSTPEPEPCGDDQDGGCNITPPMFAPIHCGETICGTAWATTSFRDTDWYQYVADSAATFEWRVKAEFPVLIFIIKGAGPDDCSSYTILTNTTGSECQEISLNSGPQPAGTYWFWVGSSSFADLPCDKNYVATLTCTLVTGACCETAAPWCEVLTQEECTAVGGSWQGIDSVCDTTDCNQNGIPDACELALGWQFDCNHNGQLDVCDIAQGACDCQGDGIPDSCQLWNLTRDILQLDDGTSENNWGLTAGGELCWLNHMTQGQPGQLQAIWCTFGSALYPGSSGVAPGNVIRTYVWDDPDADGSPADAVFLDEADGFVDAGSIDTDQVQAVPFANPVNVGGSFFIGVSVVTTSGYPATADDDGWTGAPNQGFLTFNDIPFDPTNINAALYAMGDLGYPQTVFILRAEVTYGAPPNDCNENGIPDECDIAVEFGGFCGNGVPPCFPATCDTDWNHNGTPDHCEVCGDLDGNATCDIDDYWIFVGGFGTCDGDIKYVPLADFDGDHCITLVDYRAWRMCYKMYNGYNFVTPKYVPTPDLKPMKAGQAK